MIVYDIEIKNAICKRGEAPTPGIQYCKGFGDVENMGISTLCAYDYDEDRYRVFCEDNLDEVESLFRQHDVIVGYNSIHFDNAVLACETPDLTKEYLDGKSYDIFAEIRKATGAMIGLDAMIKANGLGTGKTGNGALAPHWYQLGKMGKLVDYCIADTWLTKKLFEKIRNDGILKSPKTGKDFSISFTKECVQHG